jgi:hypothetical protein
MKKTQRLAAFVFVSLAIGSASPPARAQHSVHLTWTASADAASNPSLTYNVYRSPSCSGTFARINPAPVSATSYLDAFAAPATYCYQVTAVLNGEESVPSNQATAVVPAVITPPQSACAHRGNLFNWIRCLAARPTRNSRVQPAAKPGARSSRHRAAAP